MAQDILSKLEGLKRQVESAKLNKAAVEERLQNLEQQKTGLLTDFNTLGINPKDAGNEIIRLETEIAAEIATIEAEIQNVSSV